MKEDSVIQKATVGTPSRQLCEVYNYKSDNLHVNSRVLFDNAYYKLSLFFDQATQLKNFYVYLKSSRYVFTYE